MRALPVAALLALACVAAGRTAALPEVTDFHCFWTAARLALNGQDPYDPARWRAEIGGPFPDGSGGVRPAPCPGAFGYPLTTAVALLPLAPLPEAIAAAIWESLLVVGAAFGVFFVWSAAGGRGSALPLFAILVGCSQPLWLTIINAQFGGLLLGLVGVLALASGGAHDLLAGVALAALTLKPHVVGLVFPEVIVRHARSRRFRSLAVFATITAALLVVSLVLVRGWPEAWVRELFTTRREMLPSSGTVWGLATDAFGDGRIGVLLILAVVVPAAWTLRRVRISGSDRVALAVTGSLVVSPYAGSHDDLLLAAAWAVILAVAMERSDLVGRLLLAGLLLCASLLPWALYGYALRSRPDEATAWLVTAATALVLAAAIRARARADTR